MVTKSDGYKGEQRDRRTNLQTQIKPVYLAGEGPL